MSLPLIDAKLFKFLLAGIAKAIVGAGALFVLFNGFGASYWVSSAGNYVACGTCSSFLNTLFVFKNRRKSAAPIFLFAAHRAVCYAEAYSGAQKIVFRILSERPERFRGSALLFGGMVLYTVLNRVGERKSVFKNSRLKTNNYNQQLKYIARILLAYKFLLARATRIFVRFATKSRFKQFESCSRNEPHGEVSSALSSLLKIKEGLQ